MGLDVPNQFPNSAMARAVRGGQSRLRFLEPSIPWSLLGVVADGGVTDNTAALNALPSGVTIIGDAPAGSFVGYSGQWVVPSNFHYVGLPGTRIVSSWVNADNAQASLTQASLSAPLTRVQFYNLWLDKPDQTFTTRLIHLWADHFRMIAWRAANYRQLMYIRGSDHEIAYGVGTNGRPETGADGIRHLGNVPKAPSDLPANVYIHHNSVQSGDGAFQIGQPVLGLQGNVSTDDALVQDNTGVALSSALFLVGQPLTDPTLNNYSVTNVVVERTNGTGFNHGGLISAGTAANSVSKVSVRDCEIGVTGTSGNATLEVLSLGGLISEIDCDGVHLTDTAQTALSSVGNVAGFTFRNGVMDAPSIASTQGVVKIQDGVGLCIRDTSIAAFGSSAIVLAQNDADGTEHPVTAPVLLSNTITGVPNGGSGIDLRNVNGAVVRGNKIRGAAGATTATGVGLATAAGGNPGTTNSAITGNDVSGTNIPVVCALGQGNVVTGNIGAAACPA